jgi:DNA-binding LacI/PurR family transcriptional regulator
MSEVRRPARIKDVAELAGVSLKTVTNVVHQRSNVAPATRARVEAAIAQLDYRPSLVGRQLQSGRSTMITLALARVDEPYLGALAHAMIEAADPLGYTVMIDETAGEPGRERRASEGYPGHGVAGVVFHPHAIDPQSVAEQSRRTPMVLLGQPLPDSTADFVAIDNVTSAYEVVDHLHRNGRRRFAFLGNRPRMLQSVGETRKLAMITRLGELGLPIPDADLIIDTGLFTRTEGEHRVREALPRLKDCDALVCASDLLAIGALQALRKAGRRVPDDIAIVGWDNIIDTEYVTPTLTSVSTDLTALAKLTMEALINRIGGNREPARTYRVPHELIVRDSTARAKPVDR